MDVGEKQPVIVSKLKLYKFERKKRNVEEAASSRDEQMDLVPYEGETGDSRENTAVQEPVTLEEAEKEVAEALKEIW